MSSLTTWSSTSVTSWYSTASTSQPLSFSEPSGVCMCLYSPALTVRRTLREVKKFKRV